VQVNRLAAVGAFVIGGILLFAVGLFLIGSRRMLFKETFVVNAEFANIASLENGATVRVAGLNSGEVTAIHVPATPAARFRVEMRIRTNVRQLIRADSVATIENDGLVGNKFVQIEAGTEQAAIVADGGTIKSREPFDFTDLLAKMSETIDVVNTTITQVKTELDTALAAVTDTAQTAQDLMQDVGKQAREIMASGQKTTADLQAIIGGLRAGKGSAGKFLTDDAVYQSAKKIAADAERAMADVREAAQQAKAAVADLRGDNGPMHGLTGSLQQTLASARDAMADIAENTEALKHNFLFRGYFNRRGYFDLDELSVVQYRQGALEAGDRRAVRIWIGPTFLFEMDPSGRERLSDAGRQRLDSAMSQFVKYPRTSPFVVEGYATGTSADERFLLSRARAQLVRDYVVAKFSLDPNYVAMMAMGSEAHDSPSGDTWDGVALAIFVAKPRK
jgi:phospholipid/cholesterol/gamma-HCH transport system substrate-binding protein